MVNLLKLKVWQKILIILAVVLLTLGPIVFRELRADVAVDSASTAVVIGPLIDPGGPP